VPKRYRGLLKAKGDKASQATSYEAARRQDLQPELYVTPGYAARSPAALRHVRLRGRIAAPRQAAAIAKPIANAGMCLFSCGGPYRLLRDDQS
jgi:hypothetical protein